MSRSRKPLIVLAGLLVWAGLGSSPARAGLLPVSVSIHPEGPNFRYSYGVVLTTDSQLQTGDFFTIYDFAGFIDGSNMQPDGFSFSASPVGPTPGGLEPVDSPQLMNLTWTYMGPDVQIGQLGLGNFMARSEYGRTTDGFFTAQTHREVDGQIDSNITSTSIPVPEAPPVVPEPATLALILVGVPVLGAARYLRGKQ